MPAAVIGMDFNQALSKPKPNKDKMYGFASLTV